MTGYNRDSSNIEPFSYSGATLALSSAPLSLSTGFNIKADASSALDSTSSADPISKVSGASFKVDVDLKNASIDATRASGNRAELNSQLGANLAAVDRQMGAYKKIQSAASDQLMKAVVQAAKNDPDAKNLSETEIRGAFAPKDNTTGQLAMGALGAAVGLSAGVGNVAGGAHEVFSQIRAGMSDTVKNRLLEKAQQILVNNERETQKNIMTIDTPKKSLPQVSGLRWEKLNKEDLEMIASKTPGPDYKELETTRQLILKKLDGVQVAETRKDVFENDKPDEAQRMGRTKSLAAMLGGNTALAEQAVTEKRSVAEVLKNTAPEAREKEFSYDDLPGLIEYTVDLKPMGVKVNQKDIYGFDERIREIAQQDIKQAQQATLNDAKSALPKKSPIFTPPMNPAQNSPNPSIGDV